MFVYFETLLLVFLKDNPIKVKQNWNFTNQNTCSRYQMGAYAASAKGTIY